MQSQLIVLLFDLPKKGKRICKFSQLIMLIFDLSNQFIDFGINV